MAGRGTGDERVLRAPLEASEKRQAVELVYQRPGAKAVKRVLEPWGW